MPDILRKLRKDFPGKRFVGLIPVCFIRLLTPVVFRIQPFNWKCRLYFIPRRTGIEQLFPVWRSYSFANYFVGKVHELSEPYDIGDLPLDESSNLIIAKLPSIGDSHAKRSSQLKNNGNFKSTAFIIFAKVFDSMKISDHLSRSHNHPGESVHPTWWSTSENHTF